MTIDSNRTLSPDQVAQAVSLGHQYFLRRVAAALAICAVVSAALLTTSLAIRGALAPKSANTQTTQTIEITADPIDITVVQTATLTEAVTIVETSAATETVTVTTVSTSVSTLTEVQTTTELETVTVTETTPSTDTTSPIP